METVVYESNIVTLLTVKSNNQLDAYEHSVNRGTDPQPFITTYPEIINTFMQIIDNLPDDIIFEISCNDSSVKFENSSNLLLENMPPNTIKKIYKHNIPLFLESIKDLFPLKQIKLPTENREPEIIITLTNVLDSKKHGIYISSDKYCNIYIRMLRDINNNIYQKEFNIESFVYYEKIEE
jgi:hypothetical protein